MIPLLMRTAVLLLVLGGAWLGVAWLERIRFRRRTGGTASLTLVTGASCALCTPALAALRHHGADPRVVDIADAPASLGRPRALPLAVVTDATGRVVLRRAGRSVLIDAALLAGRARLVGDVRPAVVDP